MLVLYIKQVQWFAHHVAARLNAPFGEQARVTVHTNFTCTLDFTLESLPLLAEST
ncbi:unnamed protein product, partial [Dicrocoelium dendriticum]